METRANYVLIGSFTLAVIAAAIGFVLWFQSLHTTKQRSPLRVVFEGPAAGLRNGGKRRTACATARVTAALLRFRL